MSTNGDHPSDAPREYPMGIVPEDDPTVPELQAGSWEELARQLANRLMADHSWKKDLAARLERLEHQIALIPKRDEQ